MSAPTPAPRPDLTPYAVALAILLAVGLVAYFAFHPALPFSTGYRLEAVFKSSVGLRKGSPVRVAGVNVGDVVKIEKGPGTTTVVTMQLKDNARPIHRDATARIRPRIFLEGGFLIQLAPGSPSAPELADNGTIPMSQTTVPVLFHQVLNLLDSSARKDLRGGLDTLAGGLDDGGADGLKTLAPHLAPVLRDVAQISEAAQGTEPHDLSRLVRATNRVAITLDQRPGSLGSLVDNLATTSQAVASRDGELAESIAELSRVMRAIPPATRSVDRSLPAVERASRRVTPALPVAPRAFGETATVFRAFRRVVAPSRRARTITALATALRDLPTLVGRLGRLFPETKPLGDCLSSHILPLLYSKVPDGSLSSGRPVWQDFAHALVGLSSASQNFDGNGHALRYQVGLGGQSLSTPGSGLIAPAPSTLRSRPLPRADRKPPPLNSRQGCSDQPQPDLNAPSRSAGLRSASRPHVAEPRQSLKRLLDPKRLERLAQRGTR